MNDSFETIGKRVRDCELKAATLAGVQKADISRQKELTEKVASAKARNNLSEEIYRIFDALQNKAHERSVGAFEKLLTALLKDVLPEEGSVKLVPEFKNKDVWLDILLEKQGYLEDVLDGNGGAVTNVLSMGLRYAALTRTKNRRIMLLDEPDCWVSTQKIPSFIKVVSEVSNQINTQTFFVTHHPVSLLEGKANVVKFKQDANGKISCEVSEPRVSQWKDDKTPGVRAIELINVRTHSHTIVPCLPGATAFIGPNNLGKSTAIVSSFKAVAYGESDDSLISHGKTEASIILHLENNTKLGWTRFKKKTPAVEYFLIENGVETKRGPQKGRNQAPDWVVDLLGISRIDDLDIQIGNQKNPVFLLNDSAPKRAKILSVGKESSYLKDLSKIYDEIKSADREMIKNGEAELSRIAFRLKFFEKLAGAQSFCDQLVFESKPLIEKISYFEKIESLSDKLFLIENNIKQLSLLNKALKQVPSQAPVLEDTEKLTKLVAQIENGSKFKGIEPPKEVNAPSLEDVNNLIQVGKKIAQAVKTIEILKAVSDLKEVEAPSIEEIDSLIKKGLAINKSVKECDKLALELQQTKELIVQEEQELEKLKKELKMCPLCGHDFFEGSKHEH